MPALVFVAYASACDFCDGGNHSDALSTYDSLDALDPWGVVGIGEGYWPNSVFETAWGYALASGDFAADELHESGSLDGSSGEASGVAGSREGS